jgi:hypothetical protein
LGAPPPHVKPVNHYIGQALIECGDDGNDDLRSGAVLRKYPLVLNKSLLDPIHNGDAPETVAPHAAIVADLAGFGPRQPAIQAVVAQPEIHGVVATR